MQQVNLFLPEFVPAKPRLNLRSLSLCCLAALVLLVLIGSYLYQRVQRSRSDTAELYADGVRIGEAIRQLHGDREAQMQAARKKDGLQKQLQLQRELLADLEKRADQQGAGFSPVLAALAEAARREVWLTGIRLEGPLLTLEGETHQPKALPDWLASLQQQEAIRQRRFSQLTLTPIEHKPGLLQFTLAEPVTSAESGPTKSRQELLRETP